jgi:YVTN family beta-propeller protein
VIDGVSNQILTCIPSVEYPIRFTYNPNNNKIYCSNWGESNVTVINGSTDQVIATVSVANYFPSDLEYNWCNNKIYCCNYDNDYSNNAISIIDGSTDSVIMTLAGGTQPNSIAYNPQQNRVYVANYYSSSISVIGDVIPGIEEAKSLMQEARSFKIYPNPARNYFAIHLPQSTDCSEIKIYDVTGTLIKEASGTRQEKKMSLNGIKNGVYFVKVGNEMVKEKLIVIK